MIKELNESDKKEGLLKRLENIEGKDEDQLKAIKNQGEKQLQILAKIKNKAVDFKNISFRNSKSKKVYSNIREQSEKINYSKLVYIGSGKHQYNFTIILDLKTFAESIYNGILSLEAAEIKHRNMKDMIKRLDEYNTKREIFKAQRESTLLNAKDFYKGRTIILIAF